MAKKHTSVNNYTEPWELDSDSELRQFVNDYNQADSGLVSVPVHKPVKPRNKPKKA